MRSRRDAPDRSLKGSLSCAQVPTHMAASILFGAFRVHREVRVRSRFDSIFYDSHLPVAALPTLIALPKEGELQRRNVRPLGGREIGKPKVKRALMRGICRVGVHPIVPR